MTFLSVNFCLSIIFFPSILNSSNRTVEVGTRELRTVKDHKQGSTRPYRTKKCHTWEYGTLKGNTGPSVARHGYKRSYMNMTTQNHAWPNNKILVCTKPSITLKDQATIYKNILDQHDHTCSYIGSNLTI